MIAYHAWRAEFAKALDPRFYSIEYLDSLLWSGRAFLFENDKAACVVEFKFYPTGLRDVHCLVAAGDLNALAELAPEVEAWGKGQGCSGALIESREGWARVMKQHGYEPQQVSLRKEL